MTDNTNESIEELVDARMTEQGKVPNENASLRSQIHEAIRRYRHGEGLDAGSLAILVTREHRNQYENIIGEFLAS